MSEYTGAYVDSMTEEDLIQWHRPRLAALLEAGVDYLAIETFPALLEAKAILKLLKQEAPDIPAWISFSCKVYIKHFTENWFCNSSPLDFIV
jgi:homocysteine S-methyltransferase